MKLALAAVRLLATMLSVVVVSAASAPAQAGCTTMGYGAFLGRLVDGRKFGATLVLDTDAAEGRTRRVRGRVFVAPDYVDESVEGELVDDEDLRLRDVATGRLAFAGRFINTFQPLDHEATCDGLFGAFDDVAALLHLHTFTGDGMEPYAEARRTLNEIAPDVAEAIERNDAKRLAAHVRYPLTISFVGGHEGYVHVTDEKTFLHLAPRIMGPVLRRMIGGDVPHDLFCRGDGCMLGGGWIWFNDAGRIISIIGG